ncbi:MAG: hypothetical protein HN790_02320 [Methylococcales bacterium]|jgi:hypothetical protein|nr:hypothetical protein [Methylococcales bacterium]
MKLQPSILALEANQIKIGLLNMNEKYAFFKSELAQYSQSSKVDADLLARIESFVEDCKGAGDGEQDISFQENGRGYYAHLHKLDSLKNNNHEHYLDYRRHLTQELSEAIKNNEMTEQMSVVYDTLQKRLDK